MRFLSAEWVDEFNRALEDFEAVEDLEARGGSFSIRQVVSDGPDGDVTTTLLVGDGRISMSHGSTGEAIAHPDVTIMLSWPDAVSLTLGSFSPAQAIAEGRVRVRGDLRVLASGQAILLAARPHLESLRADTTF
ncbi:MAG TPA: SCP2 sterol-binding domain-containing protein [Acidimicrobiales bacterium]|nr:SCP2 sterol-binding domain-containing protein [Acidimicrobiales bacterium]